MMRVFLMGGLLRIDVFVWGGRMVDIRGFVVKWC